jgi:hypothetical protein
MFKGRYPHSRSWCVRNDCIVLNRGSSKMRKVTNSISILFLVLGCMRLAIADTPTTQPSPSPFGNARKIIFICDAGDPMIIKMPTLRREVNSTIDGLRAIQSFSLIFMRQREFAESENGLRMATPGYKKKLREFMEGFMPGGRTDPIPAIKRAFEEKPTLIYLLADHDFPDGALLLQTVQDLNKDHRIKISTIAFVGEADKDTEFLKILKRIAQENDGVYKYVNAKDL